MCEKKRGSENFLSLFGVKQKCHSEWLSIFWQERKKFILNLVGLQESSTDYLIDRLARTQGNANLLFDLLCLKSNLVPDSECLELFLLEVLVGDSFNSTKASFKPFLKQLWKSKSNCATVIKNSVVKLVQQFDNPPKKPTYWLLRASRQDFIYIFFVNWPSIFNCSFYKKFLFYFRIGCIPEAAVAFVLR